MLQAGCDLALLQPPKVEDAELNQQQIAAVARASAAKLTLVRSASALHQVETCPFSSPQPRRPVADTIVFKTVKVAKEGLQRHGMISRVCFRVESSPGTSDGFPHCMRSSARGFLIRYKGLQGRARAWHSDVGQWGFLLDGIPLKDAPQAKLPWESQATPRMTPEK